MLAFNWKFLTPISLVLLITTAILDKILGNYGISLEVGKAPFLYAGWMLIANLMIVWGTLTLLNYIEPKHIGSRQEFEPRPLAVSPDTKDN